MVPSPAYVTKQTRTLAEEFSYLSPNRRSVQSQACSVQIAYQYVYRKSVEKQNIQMARRLANT